MESLTQESGSINSAMYFYYTLDILLGLQTGFLESDCPAFIPNRNEANIHLDDMEANHPVRQLEDEL